MTDSLQHYGIKGMKWGVRRTPEQLGHRKPSEDYLESRRIKKKKTYEMSNRELQTINNRLQLERTYNSLNPSVSARGKRAVSKSLKTFGKVAAVVSGVGLIYATSDALGKKYNLTEDQLKSLKRGAAAANMIAKAMRG